MKYSIGRNKFVAFSLLLVQVVQLVVPNITYALTSGPSQPETKAFQQAGVSDMVDLASGDLKYNIPLLDIDGYPVNLSYQSGIGMDDEASWVGLGWNVNVGAINRQLRGLPDDASGDKFTTECYTKPRITIGGRVNLKAEFKGKGVSKGPKVKGSLTLGVFSDNYTGIGAEIGANAGISIGFGSGGMMTSSMGLGLLSSTQSGVDVSPSMSLGLKQNSTENVTVNPSLSASLGYNTRAGMKDLTLGASFSVTQPNKDDAGNVRYSTGNYDLAGSTISYNTEPINPKIQIPYKTNYGSFSIDAGLALPLVFTGVGGTGYRTIRQVKFRKIESPAYGFLYSERGKNRPNALMDFLREKENPIIPDMPAIAIPVHTPDVFSYTSQSGGGQFRLYRNTGVFFDNEATDVTDNTTLGLDIGLGAYAHGGVTLFDQESKNVTKKWTGQNSYLTKGDFQNAGNDPKNENVFFKQVGERNIEDPVLVNALVGTDPVAVNTSGKSALQAFKVPGGLSTISSINRGNRALRRTPISYLTAGEASRGGFEKSLLSYSFNVLNSEGKFSPPPCHKPILAGNFSRVTGNSDNDKRSHHISEITVNGDDGKRMIYGIPVYNLEQDEYTFAVGANPTGYNPLTNQVTVLRKSDGTIDHNKGVDHYFRKESQPAYATSYLLTAIVSPDYNDKTGDGISNDDDGTAIKFNYSKVNGDYKWRTPFDANSATLNKGALADPDDEKASFVFGSKELWYINSIETKTKIAYFITTDRADGLGVLGWLGGVSNTVKQKALKEIWLYSKADMLKPIKVVKLKYDYLLCKNVPNFDQTVSSSKKGKLTLTSLWFLYGNTEKGENHKYNFKYANNRDDSNTDSNEEEFDYTYYSSDRWGSIKDKADNLSVAGLSLTNDEYPYSTQGRTKADKAVARWQLNKIELPTGGIINVQYEADDYAYVQNKKAMVMTKILNLLDNNGNVLQFDNLKNSQGIKVDIGESHSGQAKEWFIRNYLNGSSYLYTKLFVNLSNKPNSTDKGFFDFVPCYAKIRSVTMNGTVASIMFEAISDRCPAVSPMQMAAWQRMRNDYPRYAYPGYENRVSDGDLSKSLKAAVSAIVNAAGNLAELTKSFNRKAYDKNYASRVDQDRSFIRIAKSDGHKIGGGCRVKKILIADDWNNMTGDIGNLTSIYGQEYQYTTKIDNKEVSSGVASYEPAIGGDENAFRLPIPYTQKIKGAIDNFFSFEEPLGESFFPAPNIIYSKVTIKNLKSNGEIDAQNRTGYTMSEFYTAKDFPTSVRTLPLFKYQKGPSSNYSLFTTSSINESVFSQGVSVEINDMHGKPRSTRIYNQSGSEISSVVYHYNCENKAAGEMKLKNKVSIIEENGDLNNDQIIGREIELFTDMREQESNTIGTTVNLGVDIFPSFFGLPGTLPHWPVKINDEYKLFRSASVTKVIQYYGIIDKVIKTENGSSVTTENVAYDGVTGEVLVSKTTNEFEQPIYSVSLPAYWVYKNMGAAYQNLGTVILNLQTSLTGSLPTMIQSQLHEGDELLNLLNGNHYWVVNSFKNSNGTLNNYAMRIIDRAGNVQNSLVINYAKVLRSGFRNMLGPSTATFTCLENPLKDGYLTFRDNKNLAAWRVLNISTTLFDEKWSPGAVCATCPPGYIMNSNGTGCYAPLIEDTTLCFNFCSGSAESQYSSDGSYIQEEVNSGYTVRKGNFWGGACATPSGPQTATQIDSASETLLTNESQQYPENASQSYSVPAPQTDRCSRSGVTSPLNSEFCGPLLRSGIWLCLGADNEVSKPLNEWIGFDTCINFPVSKKYYFGYAADDFIKIYLDGQPIKSLLTTDVSNFRRWYVSPVTIAAGNHKLSVEFKNAEIVASAGVEIYDNTYADLVSSNDQGSGINMLFTTTGLRGANVRFAYRNINGYKQYHYRLADGSPLDICNINNGGTISLEPVQINPYIRGFVGNWRVSETLVYQELRANNDGLNNISKGLNISKSGYINEVHPFWFFKANENKWDSLTTIYPSWVRANKVMSYDRYGQQAEEQDALGRYSAALFGFNGELPAAVASNAQNREILFNGFEDLKFYSGCYTPAACSVTNLKFVNGTDISSEIDPLISHSGNYAIRLSSPLSITTIMHNLTNRTNSYYDFNSAGAFVLKTTPGLYNNGFQPIPNKKYFFSAWIKDNSTTKDYSVPLSLTMNGINVTLKCNAVVEGWKQIEGVLDLSLINSSTALSIILTPSGTDVHLDDVRILPDDATMKTYAYDDKSLRLMAEIDENNYASFYEYDDEGKLIRVKKETSRGVMTIKESRSSNKRVL